MSNKEHIPYNKNQQNPFYHITKRKNNYGKHSKIQYERTDLSGDKEPDPQLGISHGNSSESGAAFQRAGTSNTPIREALALLEAEGLVTSSLNSKVRVTEITEESFRDINRAVLIQLLGAYQLCIEKGELSALCQTLEEKFQIQRSLFQEESTTDFINASIEFDKGFILACRSEKLLEIFDNLSSLLYMVTRINHQSSRENRKQNLLEHEAILNAVKKTKCPWCKNCCTSITINISLTFPEPQDQTEIHLRIQSLASVCPAGTAAACRARAQKQTGKFLSVLSHLYGSCVTDAKLSSSSSV